MQVPDQRSAYKDRPMPTEFNNPDSDTIRALLRSIKSIAVVGLSPNPSRPSHQVARSMQQFGYHIIPVRPAVETVLGEPAFPDLYAMPERPDLVNVFRAPEHVDSIVDACIELQLPVLWLQDVVVNHDAAQRATEHGIQVIMDRCIYRDYTQLL